MHSVIKRLLRDLLRKNEVAVARAASEAELYALLRMKEKILEAAMWYAEAVAQRGAPPHETCTVDYWLKDVR